MNAFKLIEFVLTAMSNTEETTVTYRLGGRSTALQFRWVDRHGKPDESGTLDWRNVNLRLYGSRNPVERTFCTMSLSHRDRSHLPGLKPKHEYDLTENLVEVGVIARQWLMNGINPWPTSF